MVSPEPTNAIHGYVVDGFLKTGIPLAEISFQDLSIRTDSTGYFQAEITGLDLEQKSVTLVVSHFPHKSQTMSLEKFSVDSAADTVFLDLPRELKNYQQLLFKTLRSNYKIVAVIEWFRNLEQLRNERVVIMRHDVDFDPVTAKAMGYIEHELGAQSTFYFRWLTADKDPIDYLKGLGHEIGLHYETLATYCEVKDISQHDDVTPEVIATCRDILRSEILLFESKYGDIFSICSHGAERNWLIEVPNVVLMKGQNPADYYVETYANAPELREIPEIFIADSGNLWEPFSYEEGLDRNYQSIYVLMHPIWWSDD